MTQILSIIFILFCGGLIGVLAVVGFVQMCYWLEQDSDPWEND